MLKMGKEMDYALQFLKALADKRPEKPLSLRKFSRTSYISYLFLQQIASKLKKAGIIDAQKGSEGGYKLKHELDKINLHQLLEALGGVPNLSCTSCNKKSACRGKKAVEHTHKQMISSFKKVYPFSYE